MSKREAYRRAERLHPENVESLVRNCEIEINWTGDGDAFWYQHEKETGTEFVLIDPEEHTPGTLFDHKQLANALREETGLEYNPDDLPLESVTVTEDLTVEFEIDEAQYRYDRSDGTVTETDTNRAEDGVMSPDGSWVAFTEDHDLFVRNEANHEVVRLTHDGGPEYEYATGLASPVEMVEAENTDVDPPVEVEWSPDSTKLMTYRLDKRSAAEFTLVQSTPESQFRPKQYSYAYPLPGEVGVPVAEPFVFDVEKRTKVSLDIEPIPLLYHERSPLFRWEEGGESLYYLHRPRGCQSAHFHQFDPETGESCILFEEEQDTIVDPHMSSAHVVDEGRRIIWSSERTGHHHLHLVDGTSGEITNTITEGDWVVREVLHVDEMQETVFFTASGRESDCDPYLRYLYRVSFDGSDLTLLTPERADHTITFSPSGNYFVDTYSKVDEPPRTVLRRSTDGDVVETVVECNAEQLYDTGWEPPEAFEVTAADGETTLYGLLWRPSTFDPSKEYPVIEQIYTGPHDHHVPKTFGAYQNSAQSIAELGCIVVMVDGCGTGRRSKAFRDHSYRNLSRDGIEDHIAAIRQIANDRPYMDLSSVGIYGHSAGGYDSTRAILQHPDFYDVAVSSGGNHDHRLDKAWWNELWMGYPVEDHYKEQSNLALADQLEGDLLLMHGELDHNVHPSATQRLASELMDANKDFDMLFVPNRHHKLDDHPYFVRRRWDYFVENLFETDPPSEYPLSFDENTT